MSLATSQQIAAAVVTALNAAPAQAGFAAPFTAGRAFVPGFDLKQLATLRVTVVCRMLQREQATRQDRQEDYTVEIGVQKKINWASSLDPLVDQANQCAAGDPLLLLLEQIGDFLANPTNKTMGPARWLRDEGEPLWDYGQFEDKRVFTGLLMVTYRVNR